MKHARNLFLALALLVLLYGGVYRFFYRESVRYSIMFGDGHFSGFDKLCHKFFAPAEEIDLRLTYDRPLRKYLRGHWTNPETSDFVTIAGNGTFTFQLGKTQASGQASISRAFGGYYAESQDGGLTRSFQFSGYDPTVSGESHDIAYASTCPDSLGPFGEGGYVTALTRAPAP